MSDFRERAKISIANSSRYIHKGRKQTPCASAAFDTKGGRTKPLARQWRLWQVVFTDLHRAHFVI